MKMTIQYWKMIIVVAIIQTKDKPGEIKKNKTNKKNQLKKRNNNIQIVMKTISKIKKIAKELIKSKEKIKW